MKKAAQTGTDMILVILGLFIQRDMVTSVDAHIGSRLMADFQVRMDIVQLIKIKNTGQKSEFAHFLLLFKKMVSLNMPTIFGMAPAQANRKM